MRKLIMIGEAFEITTGFGFSEEFRLFTIFKCDAEVLIKLNEINDIHFMQEKNKTKRNKTEWSESHR